MGPTCEVVLPAVIGESSLDAIDAILDRVSESIGRTRKGRSWELVVDGRPISVAIAESNTIGLAASCNAPEDYSILRRIGRELADLLGGEASVPSK